MGKKHITTDYHLKLIANDRFAGWSKIKSLDNLYIEANRHLGHLASIEKSYKSETVCEYCSYPWDPKQKNYNGCCDKDEEAARGTEEWQAVNPDTRSPTDG